MWRYLEEGSNKTEEWNYSNVITRISRRYFTNPDLNKNEVTAQNVAWATFVIFNIISCGKYRALIWLYFLDHPPSKTHTSDFRVTQKIFEER